MRVYAHVCGGNECDGGRRDGGSGGERGMGMARAYFMHACSMRTCVAMSVAAGGGGGMRLVAWHGIFPKRSNSQQVRVDGWTSGWIDPGATGGKHWRASGKALPSPKGQGF